MDRLNLNNYGPVKSVVQAFIAQLISDNVDINNFDEVSDDNAYPWPSFVIYQHRAIPIWYDSVHHLIRLREE